jgi:hypothetical protein
MSHQRLAALVILNIGSHVYAQASLIYDPSTYTSHVAGMTGMHQHTLLFIG